MKNKNKIIIPVFVIMIITLSGFELKAGITTLNLKCYLEGFYNPVINQMVKPVLLTVSLVSDLSFSDVYSNSAVLDINGNVSVNIDIPSGHGYYIKLNNWNMVETWSQSPFLFTIGGTTDVDLTLHADSTFGSNAKLIDLSPVRWGIFGGDISQDFIVDLTDLVLASYNSYYYATGNLITDITGDELTDVDDLFILDNNSSEFVISIRP